MSDLVAKALAAVRKSRTVGGSIAAASAPAPASAPAELDALVQALNVIGAGLGQKRRWAIAPASVGSQKKNRVIATNKAFGPSIKTADEIAALLLAHAPAAIRASPFFSDFVRKIRSDTALAGELRFHTPARLVSIAIRHVGDASRDLTATLQTQRDKLATQVAMLKQSRQYLDGDAAHRAALSRALTARVREFEARAAPLQAGFQPIREIELTEDGVTDDLDALEPAPAGYAPAAAVAAPAAAPAAVAAPAAPVAAPAAAVAPAPVAPAPAPAPARRRAAPVAAPIPLPAPPAAVAAPGAAPAAIGAPALPVASAPPSPILGFAAAPAGAPAPPIAPAAVPPAAPPVAADPRPDPALVAEMQTAHAALNVLPKSSRPLFHAIMNSVGASPISAAERTSMQIQLRELRTRAAGWTNKTNTALAMTFIDATMRMLRDLATRAIVVGRGKTRSRFLNKTRK